MAGRRTDLTPAVQKRICDAIRGGLFVVQAARLGGIAETTYYRWMDQGNSDPDEEPDLRCKPLKELRDMCATAGITIPAKPKPTKDTYAAALEAAGIGTWAIYREFREAVHDAEAELEARLVLELQEAFPKNPALIKEMLARRFPERWSPTQHLRVAGENGGPVQIEQTDERQLAETVQAYLKGRDDEAAQQQKAGKK